MISFLYCFYYESAKINEPLNKRTARMRSTAKGNSQSIRKTKRNGWMLSFFTLPSIIGASSELTPNENETLRWFLSLKIIINHMLHTFHPLIYPMHIATHTYTHTRPQFRRKIRNTSGSKARRGTEQKKVNAIYCWAKEFPQMGIIMHVAMIFFTPPSIAQIYALWSRIPFSVCLM